MILVSVVSRPFSILRAVKAAVDQARFAAIVDKLRESTEATFQPQQVQQVVELASKEYGFTDSESSGILGHLAAGGDLSLYGLANPRPVQYLLF